MTYDDEALRMHKQYGGKIEVTSPIPIDTQEKLSVAYTPGVAAPCREIASDKEQVFTYTAKSHMVAVVTDGSAVLGLGNIGPEASLPVMEGKSMLFKQFAGIDAFPIALDTQEPEEIIATVKRIMPMFGGINLEDIAAPQCFEVEKRLKDELDIPVFHDDQHGTAVVVLAALYNAAFLRDIELSSLRVVINGAGAAGIATARLLLEEGVRSIVVHDSHGAIHEGRTDLNEQKAELARLTNRAGHHGTLRESLAGSDVFIGVSKGNLLGAEDIKSMNPQPIIFALANPTPEIQPDIAQQAGAFAVATGRSDHPNQVNNVLAFPGIFRGALGVRARAVTEHMKRAAAQALAGCVTPTPERLIPDPFQEGVAERVGDAVSRAARADGVARQQ